MFEFDVIFSTRRPEVLEIRVSIPVFRQQNATEG
jgi:hypothetical protein